MMELDKLEFGKDCDCMKKLIALILALICMFGNNEICVGKKGKKLIWKKQDVCSFDMGEFENVLECDIKRVVLIQFG